MYKMHYLQEYTSIDFEVLQIHGWLMDVVSIHWTFRTQSRAVALSPSLNQVILAQNLLYFLDELGVVVGIEIDHMFDFAKWVKLQLGRFVPAVANQAYGLLLEFSPCIMRVKQIEQPYS